MVQHTERADARANRLRLLAAAQEVFRERGPDAEMKEIAERAGVGVGTIYRNFPTKDDLVAAIVMAMIEEIAEVVESAAAHDDPVRGLRLLLESGFAHAEHYGDLMMTLMVGKLPPACHERFEPVGADLTGIVQRGIARGVFRPGVDAGIVAAQIRTAFTPWSYQELRRTRTPAQIVAAYLDVILHGLLGDAAGV